MRKIMKTKCFILYLALAFLPYLVPGQKMTIYPGSEVTVKGGASITITNGELIIKADSAVKAGSLVLDDHANTSVTLPGSPGKTTVEQYLEYDEYHYVCSPISNQTIVLYTGIYLLDFIETNANSGDTTNYAGNWTYLVPVNTVMKDMHGYAAWNQSGSGARIYGFRGTLNNGPGGSPVTMNPAPTNSGSTKGLGWNLAGNPFPCPIDWGTGNSPVSGWTKTNIDSSIYFWDGTNQQYAVFNAAGNGAGTNGATRIIPSTQGFFIHVTTGQTSGTLSADNRVRLHDSQAFWDQTEAYVTDQLRLKVEGNNHYDEIIVRFIPGSVPGFDSRYDGYKLFGMPGIPQLYSVTMNHIDLSINTLPEITDDRLVPVGFKPGNDGIFHFTASGLISFENADSIFLEDKKLDTSINLKKTPEYQFTSAITDDSNRFVLRFSEPPKGIGEKPNIPGVQVYAYEDVIYLRKNTTERLSGTLVLYDMPGRKLCDFPLADVRVQSFRPDLSTGYYVARVHTGKDVYTRNVFISRR